MLVVVVFAQQRIYQEVATQMGVQPTILWDYHGNPGTYVGDTITIPKFRQSQWGLISTPLYGNISCDNQSYNTNGEFIHYNHYNIYSMTFGHRGSQAFSPDLGETGLV